MDLSIRAFAAGWRFKYLHHVSCWSVVGQGMSGLGGAVGVGGSGGLMVEGMRSLLGACLTPSLNTCATVFNPRSNCTLTSTLQVRAAQHHAGLQVPAVQVCGTRD